jgi:hypothetical protein
MYLALEVTLEGFVRDLILRLIWCSELKRTILFWHRPLGGRVCRVCVCNIKKWYEQEFHIRLCMKCPVSDLIEIHRDPHAATGAGVNSGASYAISWETWLIGGGGGRPRFYDAGPCLVGGGKLFQIIRGERRGRKSSGVSNITRPKQAVS